MSKFGQWSSEAARMKAVRSILFTVCIILCVISKSFCNEGPRETYRRWAKLVEDLAANEVGVEDNTTNCSATPDQSLSWIHLKLDLFDWHKSEQKSGVLRYAWPRLSFYTEHLKALTEAPSLEGLYLCASDFYNKRVCLGTKCKFCKIEPDQREIEDSNDVTLLSICKGTYPHSRYEALNPKRMEELAALFQPQVKSEDLLTAEEAMSWIETKLVREENVAKAKGEDCNASLAFTSSFRNLRRMWKEGATSKSKVEAELTAHPQFYKAHLAWLKGANMETIVPCGEGLICGWEAMCGTCDEFRGEGLWGACNLESVADWEWVWVLLPSKHENPRETLRIWIQAFTKVKDRSVDINSADRSCSASVEQTVSWGFLKTLFHEKQAGGVMNWAWPRISFYDVKFAEVLNAHQSVVFCDWAMGKDNNNSFLCLDGSCKTCEEMKGSGGKGYGNELYKNWCKRGVGYAPYNENRPRKDELQNFGMPVGIVDSPSYMSLNEVLDWNKTLGTLELGGTLEDCNVPPEVTLSQKVLRVRLMKVWPKGRKQWRWRTQNEVWKEIKEDGKQDWYQRTYEQKLRWLNSNSRKWKNAVFCVDDLVCSKDGVCVPCRMALGADNPAALKEACGVEIDVAKADPLERNGGRMKSRGHWDAAVVTFGAILIRVFY